MAMHGILLSCLSWCHVWATWNCWFSYKYKYAGLLILHLLTLLNPSSSKSSQVKSSIGRCSSELTELVPLSYSQGRSTCYSDGLHDFSVTIPRRCTAWLWNFLPTECFPLTYDLNLFKSEIKRHFLTSCSF